MMLNFIIYFKNFVTISSYNRYTILSAYKTRQSAKQIIKAENDGDEMRQAEQVHDMDAYTRPTLQILVITF